MLEKTKSGLVHRVHDPTVATSCDRLGETYFNAAWIEGRERTLEKVLEHAQKKAETFRVDAAPLIVLHVTTGPTLAEMFPGGSFQTTFVALLGWNTAVFPRRPHHSKP